MKKIVCRMNNLKLRSKMYLIYLAAGAVPMLFVGIYCFRFVSRLLSEREAENLQNSLTQAVLEIDSQFTVYENMVNYLACNQSILQTVYYSYEGNYYEMYEQLSTVFDPIIASIKYLHSDIQQITFYADSEIGVHDTTLAPLDDIRGEAWYEELLSERSFYWGINARDQTIFCAGCLSEMREMNGVVYVEMDYGEMFAPLKRLLDDNYGVIVQKNGETVFSFADFEEEYTSENSEEPDMALLSAEDGNIRRDEATGLSYIVVSCDSRSNSGLHVELYRPLALIRRTVRPMMTGLVCICLLSLTAAVLLLGSFSGMLAKKLEKLNRNMKEVKAGSMKVTVVSDSKDEIGELVRGFSEMVERIRTLIEEVYESRISQKESELKALQAQINPHFLYNSLSLINWKALEADQKDISKITLALSRFYRTALNKGKNHIRLREEISNVQSYLEIQLMMHEDEFDVEYDVDEAIIEYDTLNLILQPLVENAIGHGIDQKTDGRGKIRIRGWSEEEILYLSVEDNGVGMSEESVRTILTCESKGYGVRNVQERIVLAFGSEYGLEISSTEHAGTCVLVKQPVTIQK